MSYHSSMRDVELYYNMFPNVDFRYLIAPSEPLSPGPMPLDMSRENLDNCIEIGQRDARTAVQMGPAKYKELLMRQYHMMEHGINLDFKALDQEALE